MPTVFVKEDVMRDLREQVLVKHGKLYGAIRQEVEAALLERVLVLKATPKPTAARPKILLAR